MSEKLTGDYRKYSDKKYLYHWDISDKEDTVVTIDRIERETLENKKKNTTEQKLVLYFKEPVKPLALNKKENPSRIAKALGSRLIENWVGKKIALYVAEEPRSEDGLAIRVRTYAPKTDEIYCEVCGELVTDKTIDGKTYKAKAIANNALTKFGKYMCYDCAAAAKAEQEENND